MNTFTRLNLEKTKSTYDILGCVCKVKYVHTWYELSSEKTQFYLFLVHFFPIGYIWIQINKIHKFLYEHFHTKIPSGPNISTP